MELTDSTSACADLDGMRVHYRREGHRPTLVLLHGSGASLHIFDEITRRLAQVFDVLRIDLPGFGLTGPRPDRDYSVGAYVSFLDRLLDRLVGDRFVLAGHSFGGQICVDLRAGARGPPARARSHERDRLPGQVDAAGTAPGPLAAAAAVPAPDGLAGRYCT